MNAATAVRIAGSVLVLGVLAGRPAAAQAVRIDPAWLHADSSDHSVTFALIAGLTSANGGMNFNGAAHGALTLTVPVGWRVVLRFRNGDQVMPHSVIVIPAVTPVPVTAAAPAFPGAASRQLAQGLPTGGHQDLTFTVNRAGEFYIFCAVPGHGVAGMWIRMTVSASAPRLSVTPSP